MFEDIIDNVEFDYNPRKAIMKAEKLGCRSNYIKRKWTFGGKNA